jgi:hypothetical protein
LSSASKRRRRACRPCTRRRVSRALIATPPPLLYQPVCPRESGADTCPRAVARQRWALAPSQQLFLLLTPALDLSLALQCVPLRAVLLSVDDTNWTTLSRIVSAASLVVTPLTCGQV